MPKTGALKKKANTEAESRGDGKYLIEANSKEEEVETENV